MRSVTGTGKEADLHQGNRLTLRQIEGERWRQRGERHTPPPSLWSDKKMTAFLWSLCCPLRTETSLVAVCQAQLTRLPPERCGKPDSLLLVGKRPLQQVNLCTESVKEVPLITGRKLFTDTPMNILPHLCAAAISKNHYYSPLRSQISDL